MIKTILKILGVVVLLFVLLIGGAIFFLSEKEPAGTTGPAAEELAQKMMASVDKVAWDSTRWVQWSFLGMHDFLWDKESNWVKVSWGENEVLIYTKALDKSVAYANGSPVEEDEKEKLVQTAWDYFCNDSFWLNPVVKAFDPGTERYIVDLPSGDPAVKVKYTTGGVTPGDSYLWILDENNRPKAWKMWVSNLPIAGLETSWEGWTKLPTGANVATVHGGLGRQVEMITNLKAGMELSSLGLTADPFSDLR